MNIDELGETARKIFDLLGSLGTASPSQLASKMCQSVQNISITLKNLERKGLVKCITRGKTTWKRYTLSKNGIEKWAQLKSFATQSLMENEGMLEFTRLIGDIAAKSNIARGVIESSVRIGLDFLRQGISTGMIIGNTRNTMHSHIFKGLTPNKLLVAESKGLLARYSGIVDGNEFAYFFDSEGVLQGFIRVGPIKKQYNSLLWENEQLYAYLTSESDVLGMRISASNETFNVYAKGEKIAVFRNCVFCLNVTSDLRSTILKLSRKSDVNKLTLEKLCRVGLHMSEIRRGGLFVVGNAKEILETSELPSALDLRFSNMKLTSLRDDEVLTFAKEDGAVIVDRRGQICNFGVILRPKIATRVEVFYDRGSRHLSAAKIAKEKMAIAIVISDNGPLSIIDSGEIAFRLNV